MSSAEPRYLKINFDDIIRRLRRYAKTMAAKHRVRAIVLAGSLSKGTYTGTSDADILVISENLPERILDRFPLFVEPSLPIDIEPRAYTPSEFLRMLGDGDRFALESLETGIPLYGKQYFEHLKKFARGRPSK